MSEKNTQATLFRMNDLAWDVAATMVNAVYETERQTIRLWQVWLDTFHAAQERQRQAISDLEWQPSDTQRLVQAMNGKATDDSARTEEVVLAARVGEKPVSVSAPTAIAIDEIAPAREAKPGGTEDRQPSHPVEPRTSGSRLVRTFPHSEGRDALIQAISKAARTDTEQSARAVDVILGAITTALEQGEDVRLPGFGSFKVIRTQARVGRNPHTNEPVAIPAGRKAVFRPGSDLRKAVTSKSTP